MPCRRIGRGGIIGASPTRRAAASWVHGRDLREPFPVAARGPPPRELLEAT